MTETRITLTIGPYTRTYVLAKTTAPAAYDSGRTLELYNSQNERYILVDENDIDWQRGRNQSGMYLFELSDLGDEQYIADEIWGWIVTAGRPERQSI